MEHGFLNLLGIFVTGSLIAISAGMLGSFALLRRMSLVADSMSHIALPGIALGLMFHFNVLLGSVIFLLAGVFIVWLTENKTNLNTEALVGVLYTLSLAVAALLATEEEILDSLFGNIANLGGVDFIIGSVVSIVVIFVLLYYSKKIILSMISSDFARSLKINPKVVELIFLLVFAVTIAVGIKFIGALLMGALIIIPSATARNLSTQFKNYMLLSALFGFLSVNFGLFLSIAHGIPAGPVIVVISSVFFFLSVFFRK